MKKALIGMAVLAILVSGAIGLGKEKAPRKQENVKITAEEKAWREKLETMTPEERRVTIAKKALEDELAPWAEVRKIALSEKAEKTVAAIDKIIAAKREVFAKKMAAAERKKAATSGTEKQNAAARKAKESKKTENK